MGIQNYATVAPRSGIFLGKIYKDAICRERLARHGRTELLHMNSSDTYVGRRYLPYGATSTSADSINRFFANGTGDRVRALVQAHQSQEGMTGPPDHLQKVDTTVLIQEYDCLYSYSSKAAELYEDNIPAEQTKKTGQRIALVNEMILFLALKACTNVYYGGAGTSLSTVNGTLTLPLQNRMLRNLDANHAEEITSMIAASPKYDTAPIGSGFLAFVHTDMRSTIQGMSGFINPYQYASGKPLEGEIGAVDRVRYIGHPDMVSQQDGGATVAASPGMLSTSGSNVDVYSGLLMGADAWSHIVVRGKKGISPVHIPHTQRDKSDPHGRKGYVGASWRKAVMLENNGWMAAFHVCAEVL